MKIPHALSFVERGRDGIEKFHSPPVVSSLKVPRVFTRIVKHARVHSNSYSAARYCRYCPVLFIIRRSKVKILKMEGSSILLPHSIYPLPFRNRGLSRGLCRFRLHAPLSPRCVSARHDFSLGVLPLSRSAAVDNTGDILK